MKPDLFKSAQEYNPLENTHFVRNRFEHWLEATAITNEDKSIKNFFQQCNSIVNDDIVLKLKSSIDELNHFLEGKEKDRLVEQKDGSKSTNIEGELELRQLMNLYYKLNQRFSEYGTLFFSSILNNKEELESVLITYSCIEKVYAEVQTLIITYDVYISEYNTSVDDIIKARRKKDKKEFLITELGQRVLLLYKLGIHKHLMNTYSSYFKNIHKVSEVLAEIMNANKDSIYPALNALSTKDKQKFTKNLPIVKQEVATLLNKIMPENS